MCVCVCVCVCVYVCMCMCVCVYLRVLLFAQCLCAKCTFAAKQSFYDHSIIVKRVDGYNMRVKALNSIAFDRSTYFQ